jgi:hypothetical protein
MSNLQQKESIVFNAINDGGSATFATITANVEQKMLKRNNPLKNSVITKKVKYNFLLNAIYQNAVNKQREKEGKEADFQSSSNWHEKVYDGVNGSIVRNKKSPEQTYLSGIVRDAEVLQYYVDGIAASPEEMEVIKAFKQSSSSAKNQELEKEIIFRTIKIENIIEVRANDRVIKFGLKK